MVEISLIRHVKVAGEPALYGSTDVPPTMEDNERLLAKLMAIQQQGNAYDVVITSPLKRCSIIAEVFAKQNKIPLHSVESLQEISFGHFDGIPFDDATFSLQTPAGKQNRTKLEKFWQAPAAVTLPRAECLADFNQRVSVAWYELIESFFQQNNGVERPRRILLLAHGGVIRMILAQILQLDWQSPVLHQNLQIVNASLSQVTVTRPFEKSEQNHFQVNFIGLPLLQLPLC